VVEIGCHANIAGKKSDVLKRLLQFAAEIDQNKLRPDGVSRLLNLRETVRGRGVDPCNISEVEDQKAVAVTPEPATVSPTSPEKAGVSAEGGWMKVLVATDAWPPQTNGVVRTLRSLARAASKLGVMIDFLSPEGFSSFPVPTYPGLRLAMPNLRRIAERIEEVNPDAIHIATEGPIGFAVRSYCRKRSRPFTTSYTTRFPEYISARLPIPANWVYAALRQFHASATVTMVATLSLMIELGERGLRQLGRCSNLSSCSRGHSPSFADINAASSGEPAPSPCGTDGAASIQYPLRPRYMAPN
jgi:Glycosyltransferase Family 4